MASLYRMPGNREQVIRSHTRLDAIAITPPLWLACRDSGAGAREAGHTTR